MIPKRKEGEIEERPRKSDGAERWQKRSQQLAESGEGVRLGWGLGWEERAFRGESGGQQGPGHRGL